VTDNNLYSIIPYKDRLIKLSNPSRAFAIYKDYRLDLLTGKRFDSSYIDWTSEIDLIKLSSSIDHPRVIHLFYELGHQLLQTHLISSDSILAIDIEYEKVENVSVKKSKKINLDLISKVDFKEYKLRFKKGYDELLQGNCYQFNLTAPFEFKFKKDLSAEDFIFSLWKNPANRGRYASATFIPLFDKLFLSNSPECLFQIQKNKLITMPIKGTVKYSKAYDLKMLWKNLCKDSKSQAELYMITDLLRNDLSSIDRPIANVVKKKFPLVVPSLLHQCSLIEVDLNSNISMLRIIEKMFPGGSVTGAPKKSSMRILNSLEQRERGFYCGSTLILYKDMKSASINIRSGIIDFSSRLLNYQAGGGITLKSSVSAEYREMTYKLKSFIAVLTL
jgi:anthranilate/para-aminobenzoate synthase component I